MSEAALHIMDCGGGVYFLTTGTGEDIVGTLLDDGGGWWKCRAPNGLVRTVYVPRGTPDPVLHAARATSRTNGRIVGR